MKYSQGFTLVELLVTVSIISILAVVAAPSFLQTLANQRMKSAAYDLSATFAEARYQAALQRVTMNVTTTGSAAQWKAAGSSNTADIHWRLIPALTGAAALQQSTVDRRVEIASDLDSVSALFLQSGSIAVAEAPNTPLQRDVFFRICDSAVTGEKGYTVVLGRFGGSRVYSGAFGAEGIGAQACT